MGCHSLANHTALLSTSENKKKQFCLHQSSLSSQGRYYLVVCATLLTFYYYYHQLFNLIFWLLPLPSFFFVRRVIINEQRVIELSLYYISNNFLSVLAFPNNVAFCITPTFYVISSFSIHLSNSFVKLPRAPITVDTTFNIFSFQNLPNFGHFLSKQMIKNDQNKTNDQMIKLSNGQK